MGLWVLKFAKVDTICATEAWPSVARRRDIHRLKSAPDLDRSLDALAGFSTESAFRFWPGAATPYW